MSFQSVSVGRKDYMNWSATRVKSQAPRLYSSTRKDDKNTIACFNLNTLNKSPSFPKRKMIFYYSSLVRSQKIKQMEESDQWSASITNL